MVASHRLLRPILFSRIRRVYTLSQLVLVCSIVLRRLIGQSLYHCYCIIEMPTVIVKPQTTRYGTIDDSQK